MGVPTFTRSPFQKLHIMTFTQDPVPVESELFPRGQLSLTTVAGETSQMVDVLPRPPHPVRGLDRPVTLGTLGSKLPEKY